MALAQQIDELLKDAMRSSLKRETALLRMIKSRLQQKASEKGFAGEMTDEITLEVIAAYVKQMEKVIPDYEKAGERGVEKIEQIRFEIEYLRRFLPAMMSEAETLEAVKKIIADLGIGDVRQIGKIMGLIMKDYKGRMDPQLAKKLATEILTGQAAS